MAEWAVCKRPHSVRARPTLAVFHSQLPLSQRSTTHPKFFVTKSRNSPYFLKENVNNIFYMFQFPKAIIDFD